MIKKYRIKKNIKIMSQDIHAQSCSQDPDIQVTSNIDSIISTAKSKRCHVVIIIFSIYAIFKPHPKRDDCYQRLNWLIKTKRYVIAHLSHIYRSKYFWLFEQINDGRFVELIGEGRRNGKLISTSVFGVVPIHKIVTEKQYGSILLSINYG